ncbi:MAG: acetate--CoA ligase, partial [Bacteroidia bacterium]|nr:acetate--CoA ligase [Bacteroidia bacterium]
VFGGFSTAALAERINDAQCKLLITADGALRGDKIVPLKFTADRALFDCPSVKATVVVRRTGEEINLQANEYWWHEIIEGRPADRPAEVMDAKDPLFILYTSGSTGKPKGVLHAVGGYMVHVGYSFRNVFQPRKDDVFWCTADVGWITGHSYSLYGPLLNGTTTLFFEGVPNWPDGGRYWEVCDKHKVNIFYTAPTAIRSLMTFGDKQFENKSLDTLRVLGTVGEPINAEAWQWYRDKVGKGELPIVDTWWQTETGGIMIAPLAGITPAQPTYATHPLPGVFPVLVDETGKTQNFDGTTVYGHLCIARPWPGLAATTYGDHERFVKTYFSAYAGYYFTGDGCFRDSNGFRITGRVDDVINVSGHRIGTAEIENAINEHPTVVESAVVGFAHNVKGQGIHAFVLVVEPPENPEKLAEEVRAEVVRRIGSFAKPERITFVQGLPKTRSGKIMRRILRNIAAGKTDDFGDVSTLLDPAVVQEIAGRKFY